MPAVKKIEDEQTDTAPPALPGRTGPANVNVKITKFGAGKVSTGEHVAELGDKMAKAGDVLKVAKTVAEALESRGLAEIE